MKIIYKITTALLVILVITMVSCSSEESAANSAPYISYVRITDPISSDSLIVKAGQGQLLALIGDNLQNTTEVWFNNRQAFISPTYVTNKSIITNVPGKIPTEINNEIRLINKNGSVYSYSFKVEIGEPYIKAMRSEYVPDGQIATIQGDFFYEPMTVTFTGGKQAVISSIDDDKILNVVVPDGAQPGPITIKTNFGETVSDFYFRDNRNIFVSGAAGSDFIVTQPGAGDPLAINGNYIRIKKNIGSWDFNAFFSGGPDEFGEESRNVPDDALIHPENYNLKFEINTLKPYNANIMKFQLLLDKASDFDAYYWSGGPYLWQPPYDTHGQWETIVIPLNQVLLGPGHDVNPNGYYSRLIFHDNGALDADISVDNFRVVPKILK
nr:glycan-binding surface protein [uncultured Flavobacterium sp.]